MGEINSLEQAYQVLKCPPEAASDEVERSYKELQEQYQQALYDASELPSQYTWLLSTYPDLSSLIGPKALELPDKYLALLTRRLSRLNEAYEIIRNGKASAEVITIDISSEPELLSFFGQFNLDNFYFVSPNIPEAKLNNARTKSAVPSWTPVLALFDCTRFGTAGNHILFTCQALYYREEDKQGYIPYDEFAKRKFTIEEDAQHISFGNDEKQYTAGAAASFLAYEILNKLRYLKCGIILSPPESPLTREHVIGTINRFIMPGSITPDPQIGGDLKAKAIGQCQVPFHEPILGIINSTHGKLLVLGLSGLYAGTENTCKYIPYSEFPDRDFKVKNLEWLSVGKGQDLPVEKTCIFVVATMLQELKDKVQGAL